MLLRECLSKFEGLSIGSITSTLGVAIKDAVESFRRLSQLELLSQKEGMIVLTENGRNWVNANQRLFAFTGERSWRSVPDEYRGNQISAFSPYVPRLSKIPRSFFAANKGSK
jgi:hypothetical protein